MSHNVDMENIAHAVSPEPIAQPALTEEERAAKEAQVKSQPKPVSAPAPEETPAEAVTRLDLAIATLDPQLERAEGLVQKSIRCIGIGEAKIAQSNEKRAEQGLAPEEATALAYVRHHLGVLPKYQAQVTDLTARVTELRAERKTAQQTVQRQTKAAARKAAKQGAGAS